MSQIFRLVILALALVGLTFPCSAREDQLLVSDWRFKLGDLHGAETNGFNDADWQTVSLPHNWGWEQAQLGQTTERGPGWYRHELKVAGETGKRVFLRFEAASLVADVYFNGRLILEHRGGFGAFAVEITKLLSGNVTSLLAVRVDNARALDVAPLQGDFSVYGGLYRPVHLIVTGEENFCLTDHGSAGVAWLQTNVTPAEATLELTAQVSNGGRGKIPLTLAASIVDADGKTIVSQEQPVILAPKDTAPYFLRLNVPHPHLWNGRKDPYLYKAVAELRSTNGVVDRVEQPLGLRSYAVDPDKGFSLNGQPYPVHGVNRYPDYLDKGWALSEADMEEDVSLIKEMGATAVRCSYFQQSDYFYGLCDKAGLLVSAELPLVNLFRDAVDFGYVSRNQLLDLIRQNINHPSIFMWGLCTEITPRSDDPHRALQDLKTAARGEDPSRPTFAATMTDARPQMNLIPDLLGWNIYPGWYGNAQENFTRDLDARRNSSRQGGFCLSEYGAGANPTQHEQNPVRPYPPSKWHPEEWQSEMHELAWAAMKTRPFIWGSFAWCMFDFSVGSRHEGGVQGQNDQGLITRDRKTKKDAFYFYKANWSDEPVLYITSRRFTERTNSVADVKIYANASDPELFINGVSQGKRGDGENGVYTWKNLTLAPGENKISARAQVDGKPLTDECVWNLKPAP
jgi:beta-galactosidase